MDTEEKERNRLAAEKNLAYIRRQFGQDIEQPSVKRVKVDPPMREEQKDEDDPNLLSVYIDGLQADVSEKQLEQIFERVVRSTEVELDCAAGTINLIDH